MLADESDSSTPRAFVSVSKNWCLSIASRTALYASTKPCTAVSIPSLSRVTFTVTGSVETPFRSIVTPCTTLSSELEDEVSSTADAGSGRAEEHHRVLALREGLEAQIEPRGVDDRAPVRAGEPRRERQPVGRCARSVVDHRRRHTHARRVDLVHHVLQRVRDLELDDLLVRAVDRQRPADVHALAQDVQIPVPRCRSRPRSAAPPPRPRCPRSRSRPPCR